MIAVAWSDPVQPPLERVPILSLRDIALQVCAAHKVAYKDFMSRRRSRPYAWARQEAMWRAANETAATFNEIGKAYGNRDHTTVIHGIRRHEERMKEGGNGAQDRR